MSGPREVMDSEPNVGEDSDLTGGTGVSSERVGSVRGVSEEVATGAQDEPQDPDSRDDAEPADPPPPS